MTDMDNVNKTLYIPLYGKAYVSRKGLFLKDEKAEAIWAAEGFALKGKSRSKYLAYFMGIRAAVFDGWVLQQMAELPAAAVIHIGCGMDSRVLRTGGMARSWYDVDFAQVISERRRYYAESGGYRMVEGDARDCAWLAQIPGNGPAIVVMEGVSMYLTNAELKALASALGHRFGSVRILIDCYTGLAARLSRYRNPVNDVGVTEVYGLDAPESLEDGRIAFVKEHDMTPPQFTDMLRGMEKHIFRKLYAGKISKKLYRLFEYRSA